MVKAIIEMRKMKRGSDQVDALYKSRGYPEGFTFENLWRQKSG